MRVLSAFFADHVSIYEQKLFVQGGVWSWYNVSASELPATRTTPVALILQVSPDDLGTTARLAIRIIRPDGSEAEPVLVEYSISSDYRSEYLCQALPLTQTFESLGRHVVLLETSEESDAFSLPLNVMAAP